MKKFASVFGGLLLLPVLLISSFVISPNVSAQSVSVDPCQISVSVDNITQTLQEGDAGPQVISLQQALNKTTPFYVAPDGKYGQGTSGVVKLWQSEHSLVANGVFDNGSKITMQGLLDQAQAWCASQGFGVLPAATINANQVSLLLVQLQQLQAMRAGLLGQSASSTSGGVVVAQRSTPATVSSGQSANAALLSGFNALGLQASSYVAGNGDNASGVCDNTSTQNQFTSLIQMYGANLGVNGSSCADGGDTGRFAYWMHLRESNTYMCVDNDNQAIEINYQPSEASC